MPEAQNNNEQSSGGGAKKILMLLALTNVASLGGLAYFVMTKGTDSVEATPALEMAEEPKEDVPIAPTANIGAFTINLADPGQSRYLKAILKAQVSNSDTMKEIEAREHEIRDIVISYLSSLTVKETQGARSKSAIRVNLQKRLNKILRSGEVTGVFLTEFVTQ